MGTKERAAARQVREKAFLQAYQTRLEAVRWLWWIIRERFPYRCYSGGEHG
jgi:hypothetical protein